MPNNAYNVSPLQVPAPGLLAPAWAISAIQRLNAIAGAKLLINPSGAGQNGIQFVGSDAFFGVRITTANLPDFNAAVQKAAAALLQATGQSVVIAYTKVGGAAGSMTFVNGLLTASS